MLFDNLKAKALEIIKEDGLSFLDGGIGKTLTCVSLKTKNGAVSGVALSPKNEGEPLVFKKDSIENLLLDAQSFSPNKRSIGLAIINAIGQYQLQKDPIQYYPNLRVALSKHIQKLTCKESKIVFIGHLVPVVNALKQIRDNVIVFCRQKSDIQNGVYNDIYEYEALEDADVVVITGAALIGSTIDAILAMCSPKAHIILAGFSAGIYPLWLKDTAICEVASINLANVPLAKLLNYSVEDIFVHQGYILKSSLQN
jgi:uncharacterized protein (DUF4213/DUF364 family)